MRGFGSAVMMEGDDLSFKLPLKKSCSYPRYRQVKGRKLQRVGELGRPLYFLTYLSTHENDWVMEGTTSVVFRGPGGCLGESNIRTQLIEDKVRELTRKRFLLVSMRHPEQEDRQVTEDTGCHQVLQLICSRQDYAHFQHLFNESTLILNGYGTQIFSSYSCVKGVRIGLYLATSPVTYVIKGVGAGVQAKTLHSNLIGWCIPLSLFPSHDDTGNWNTTWTLTVEKPSEFLDHGEERGIVVFDRSFRNPGSESPVIATRDIKGTVGSQRWEAVKKTKCSTPATKRIELLPTESYIASLSSEILSYKEELARMQVMLVSLQQENRTTKASLTSLEGLVAMQSQAIIELQAQREIRPKAMGGSGLGDNCLLNLTLAVGESSPNVELVVPSTILSPGVKDVCDVGLVPVEITTVTQSAPMRSSLISSVRMSRDKAATTQTYRGTTGSLANMRRKPVEDSSESEDSCQSDLDEFPMREFQTREGSVWLSSLDLTSDLLWSSMSSEVLADIFNDKLNPMSVRLPVPILGQPLSSGHGLSNDKSFSIQGTRLKSGVTGRPGVQPRRSVRIQQNRGGSSANISDQRTKKIVPQKVQLRSTTLDSLWSSRQPSQVKVKDLSRKT